MDKSPANTLFRITIRQCFSIVSVIIFPCLIHLCNVNAQAKVPVDSVETPRAIPVDTNASPVAPHDTLNSLKDFDSTVVDTSARARLNKRGKHSALKAGLLSAVLPGLGQAYNKHYWKIPIVYAGFGGLAYGLYYTSSNFNGYRTAYRQDEATTPVNYNASYNGVSDPGALKEYRDYFKKYLDISSIGIGAWYMLTIIDAVVDAHLMTWNMKDDISVSWRPDVSPVGISNNLAAAGVTFTLVF